MMLYFSGEARKTELEGKLSLSGSSPLNYALVLWRNDEQKEGT
jgi:hypothetical protein